ncbi:MAG: hypothetical protein ACYDHG_15550 [Desulfomonilaceae bacterium]
MGNPPIRVESHSSSAGDQNYKVFLKEHEPACLARHNIAVFPYNPGKDHPIERVSLIFCWDVAGRYDWVGYRNSLKKVEIDLKAKATYSPSDLQLYRVNPL